jgi:hypothetical protein
MNAANEITRLVDDLAAHWTEPTLEILNAAGIPSVSVELEIEAWHVLKGALRSELRWQRAFRSSTMVSLTMLREQVLQKTALFVFQKHNPGPIPRDLGATVRLLAADRRSTAAERGVYMEIVRQPAMKAAFKAPSRSDFVPRLRLSAVGH